MSIKVFIDGAEGTTGLRLADRLKDRKDIELIKISQELRKDSAERANLANSADIVFLCLPDAAAKEAVANITNPNVKVIDPSTAHRTDNDWVYGFPELSKFHRESVASAKRLSNPGCHASGFAALVYPIVSAGIAGADYPFACHSLTGYSGAGRPMIEKYADPNRNPVYASPRQYALAQKHKHLPEMKKVSGLVHAPLFNPIIGDFYAGMLVTVPIHTHMLRKKYSAQDFHKYFSEFYAEQKAVEVMPFGCENDYIEGMIDSEGLAGRDIMEIYVCGHEDQVALISRFDNLGKGASGSAIQCMNIMCGADEMTGLVL